jgi:hypothetical protein
LGALQFLARHLAGARRAFGVQEKRRRAEGDVVFLGGRRDACPAGLFLGPRHHVALLPVEQKLRGVPLHHGRRRTVDAHRKSVGVCQSAAEIDVRSERVLLDPHGLLRFQLIQARHGNLRVLL